MTCAYRCECKHRTIRQHDLLPDMIRTRLLDVHYTSDVYSEQERKRERERVSE